jgi:hypothetical protein
VADAARVIGLIAAAGGFWLLRNLIVVGNPVYPVKVGLLGNIVFDAPPDVIRERGGFAILHYATDTHVWRTFLWPAVRDGFALPGIVALAACVVAIVAAFGGRRRPRTVLVAVTGLAGLVLLAVYAATPYSAQGPDGLPVQALVNTRYGLPAVATGAAVAAALGARGRRWALASTTLALIATVDALARIDNVAPIVAHAVRPVRVAEALVLLALVAGAVFAVRLTPRPLRFVPLAFAALVLVAGGYFHQRYYSDHRYIGRDPAIDAALQLPGRHTIAITGPTPQGILPPNLPLNGPRLDNRVRVLGRPDRHLLLPLRTRADLAAALHGEPYDLLYVLKYRGRSSPAAGWALALGWHQVAAGETSVLFQR